jgi:hypothetical protein
MYPQVSPERIAEVEATIARHLPAMLWRLESESAELRPANRQQPIPALAALEVSRG